MAAATLVQGSVGRSPVNCIQPAFSDISALLIGDVVIWGAWPEAATSGNG